MNITFKNIYITIKSFLMRIKRDQISEYSAQACFFILLSAFPFLILVLNIIQFTPLEKSALESASATIIPNALAPLVQTIINDLYSKTSGTILSITALTAIWSASKGMRAVTRGLSSIYHVRSNKNFLFERLSAIIDTIVLLLSFIVVLSLFVFGRHILHYLKKNFVLLYELATGIFSQRFLLTLLLFSIIFIYLYKSVKYKTHSLFFYIPGAVFASLGWILFSFLFSVFFNHSSNYSHMYGSLTTVVLMMIWLYICLYIFFLGAEVNMHFALYFEIIRNRIKNRKQQL